MCVTLVSFGNCGRRERERNGIRKGDREEILESKIVRVTQKSMRKKRRKV